MTNRTSKISTLDAGLSYGIAAIERDTGFSKDTLRVWERRYGFPAPRREAGGERAYPPEQLEKLRLMRRLIDQGKRPSKIVGLSTDELLALLESLRSASAAQPADTGREQALVELVRLHRGYELYTTLHQLLLRQGLQRFVADTIAPLNEAVGQAWLRGELQVTDEHLYTEQVQTLLRGAIGAISQPAERPRILLTTLPEEMHALGLLMVEATLVPEGASCISLGTQTPLDDIRSAAGSGDFDIVGLSFSAAYPARQAVRDTLALRAALPADTSLWVGGAALQGKERRLTGVRVIKDLDDTLRAVRQWRERMASPALQASGADESRERRSAQPG